MGNLLPIETINTIRNTINNVITIYGFDAKLYTAENPTHQEDSDVYMESPDISYKYPEDVEVFIEWAPTAKKLRGLGVFVEDEIPVICWLRGDLDITRNSYLKIPINYSMSEVQEDEFELVDQLAKHMYDSVVVQCWKIVPRRK